MNWKKMQSNAHGQTEIMQAGSGVLVKTVEYDEGMSMVYIPDARVVGGCGEWAEIRPDEPHRRPPYPSLECAP